MIALNNGGIIGVQVDQCHPGENCQTTLVGIGKRKMVELLSFIGAVKIIQWATMEQVFPQKTVHNSVDIHPCYITVTQ